MLKLLKYEFRKGLTTLLVMLGVTAALEAYFLIGLYTEADQGVHAVIAAFLLMGMAFGAFGVALVRGVTSYSNELKSRSAYLIFMTPHSTRKIMASKFLFTFTLGVLFAVLYGALGLLDVSLLLAHFGKWEEALAEINQFFRQSGFHLEQYVFAVIFALGYVALSVLSFCAVAYLAITLSHTFFRDKKWRGLAALVFFFLLNQGISLINGLFPQVFEVLHYQDAPGLANVTAAYGIDTTPDFGSLLIYILPQACVSLVTILASLFGCAWMLEKKVSL